MRKGLWKPWAPLALGLAILASLHQIEACGEEKAALSGGSASAAESAIPLSLSQVSTVQKSKPSLNLTNIPNFALTNEFGQPVRLREYLGQAVAITFFFARCPIPEYCPRLARNFAEACEKLTGATHGPTNWKLLSVSFDPGDTPKILQDYGRQYRYDSNHWTFLTGDPEHIKALTKGFGLTLQGENGMFAHDFRTAVFDASGAFQTMFLWAAIRRICS